MAHDSNGTAPAPFEGHGGLRQILVGALNACAVGLTLPLALLPLIEARFFDDSEAWFTFAAQLLAVIPGYPGMYFRRSYYWWTLEACSLRAAIGFGAYFSHRTARVEDHVYIGSYAIIGSAHLQRWALIGSRASVLSGGALHELDDEGRWLPSDLRRAVRVTVGAHAWVGEGSIVMADVGRGALVAAGSVVSSPVADGIMVGGNPARFVRALSDKPLQPSA